MRFYRPTYAEINLAAISQNIRAIKRKIGARCGVMAVVKANGYSHGIVEVAGASLKGGADWLAVATVDEAVTLRKAGFKVPVFILGPVFPGDATVIIRNNITVALGSVAVAKALDKEARKQKRTVKVHIKVDTGMGRFGFWFQDLPKLLPQLESLKNINYEGIFTHFADSDIKDPTYTKFQLHNFRWLLKECQARRFSPPIVHAANSGAILQHPETYYDFVRPGIMVCGLYPSPETKRTIRLKPALTLITQVINLRRLPPGRFVSYGRTYQTRRTTTIATVPLGYGDGYPRHLSNKGYMMLKGRKAPIVGRVCMDQIMIDVSRIPAVKVGDEVIAYGRKGKNYVPIEDLASLAGTIPNEMVCILTPRIPRVYK